MDELSIKILEKFAALSSENKEAALRFAAELTGGQEAEKAGGAA